MKSSGCGKGSCGCATAESPPVPTEVAAPAVTAGSVPGITARINGIALHAAGDRPDDATLRQRAYSELLRQRAVGLGLLGADDLATDDGILTEAASSAIERLLETELVVPTPDEPSCRRYFESNPAKFQLGEKVHLRHILFAVTPGTNVSLLRQRAASALLDARCRGDDALARFAAMAAELSNCPSGAEGGDLGWLTRDACAPEFGREIFSQSDVGVLPRLVHSRFGLHVVEVLGRQAGAEQTFAEVRGAVQQLLQQQSYVAALRQYLQLLAAGANLEGVELDEADSLLVQ